MASLGWFAALLTIFISLQSTGATFFYPNPQASQLEHILVDVHGAYASNFSSAITPCTNYVSGSQNFGRETAAQWLRVAFHDFVTADVKTGTGGMDASIGFETLREEDSGSAFNDSLAFFRPFVTKDVSTADLIALSVSMSVGNCGGPQIPVRGGRIDATEAGAFGVPAPETDLNLTLSYFESAGFNQVDSIGLTACGHTLGSVHHGGFPTVVGPEAVTPNNTAGGIHFDETVDIFDIKVVNEYLDGSGNAGGPLVTSFNETSRSDLRLYESDGNETMIQLAEQGEEGFLNTCVDLLQRMVETVPAGVSLSSVVEPVGVKPVNVSLDFGASGDLVLSGYLRILTPTTTTSSPPTTLTLTYSIDTSTSTTTTPSQTLQLTAEPSTGTSTFGTTSYFPFTLPISTLSTSITLTAQDQTFTIQTQTFILPSLSNLSPAKTSTNITIASLSSYSEEAPAVKISVPLPQDGTWGPRIVEFSGDEIVLGRGEDIGGYEIWEGTVQFGDVSTGGVTIEVFEGSGGEVKDVVVLY